jgi:hypothetical protein
MKFTLKTIIFLLLLLPLFSFSQQVKKMNLSIAKGNRYFQDELGKPFFWLGDTGWLLFSKLSRPEAIAYLNNRANNGFNVIQVMGIHQLDVSNFYGDAALINKDIQFPAVTKGSDFEDSEQYDYWDHVDFIIDEAAKRKIFIAFVAVWGGAVKDGDVKVTQAEKYANFLANRFGKKPNIIWMNGGDVKGSEYKEVWETIGNTIKSKDKSHLMTFHPRGRTTSSEWFHQDKWLDFNAFQSGHRRYDQDTLKEEKRHYGEDNWRYVLEDYPKKPIKPTLDVEPSYEAIPEGLHDSLEVRWTASAIRRYAYWSVFSGTAGFTYGHNAVMQFYKEEQPKGDYGVRKWEFYTRALNDPGAKQMHFIKDLMLSVNYFNRVPDQSLVANQKDKYDYLAATRGDDYAFIYTWTGREMEINMGKIKGDKIEAFWFNPSNGKMESIGKFDNKGTNLFDPPGMQQKGNDWVLVLKST